MGAGKVALMQPARTEQPLEVATELVRRLQEAGVNYGVYKNIESVPAGLAGCGDLDLIVAAADMERFRAVLFELKAVRGHCPGFCDNAVDGGEDWFVPDFAQGDYIHLAVRRSNDTSALAGPTHSVARRWRSLIYSAARRLSRSSPRFTAAKRTVAPSGMVIALIGPDGSGKSSQAPQLARLFQKKFRCATVYLGSGDGGWGLRRWATRRYHQRRPAQRDKAAPARRPGPKGSGIAHATVAALAGLAAAIERYVGLHKARRMARAGAIVICDRWPQNLQPGLFDGPRPLPTRPSRIVRSVSWVERALYRRMEKHEPDLAIHMIIDFDTSRARKPGDREPTDFEQRLSLMREMRARNPDIMTIDARGSFAEVTRLLFHAIWVVLLERSGRTRAADDYRHGAMAADAATVPDARYAHGSPSETAA